MHISFDFSLKRWMIGIWFYNDHQDMEIYIDIGPCEFVVSFLRSK